jgi:hypothetical protein
MLCSLPRVLRLVKWCDAGVMEHGDATNSCGLTDTFASYKD